jgi:hypothetical protein
MSSTRTAGLGLLAYGIGTPAAFMTIGSPGGEYSDRTVTDYIASGHWAAAIAIAYLGAFAALGLIMFGHGIGAQVGRAAGLLRGLAVGGGVAGVVGWFLVGGIAVAFAEGGDALTAVPHPVVYLVSEMSNLVAVCASAFLAGGAVLVLAARAELPRWLRITGYVAGACGMLAAFFFPLFLFWLWAIGCGAWVVRAGASSSTEPVTEVQPA